MKDIPQYHTFTKIEAVEKGWSQDKKYYIETSAGEKLLLRLSARDTFVRKQQEFDMLKTVSQLAVPISQPLEFGYCSGGEQVYMLLSWLEGEDLEQVLPSMPEKEQYKLGIQAGRWLKRMHSIPAPQGLPPWGPRFSQKIDRNIASYRGCGIKFTQDDRVLSYVKENRHLLTGREQTLQHGDFHVGNMVFSPQGGLGIIDFNRWDYGDPWEEFNRIVWSANVSKAFAAGNLDGYFGNQVPEVFFRLMALYISANALASIPWAIPFGDSDVQIALKNIGEVLDFYQGYETSIPTWYKN